MNTDNSRTDYNDQVKGKCRAFFESQQTFQNLQTAKCQAQANQTKSDPKRNSKE